ARDLDPGEQALLAEGRIKQSAVEELSAAQLSGSTYLHIDLDLAADLPGLRFRAAGKSLFDDVIAAVDHLLADVGPAALAAIGVAATIDPAAEGSSDTFAALQRTGWIDSRPLLVRRARVSDADA